METTQAPPFFPIAAAAPRPPLPRFLPSLALLLTGCTDFFLWQGAEGGAPISCLFLLLAVVFALSGGRPIRKVWFCVGLIALCTLQGVLEFKPSTFLVSSALLLTILGQVHFPEIGSQLGRSVEVILAAIFPLPVLLRLRRTHLGVPADQSVREERRRDIWRLLQIVLPALVLGLVFSIFFAEGNPIFGKFAGDVFSIGFEWLAHLDLSLARTFFWLVAFTLLLSLFAPARTGLGGWIARRSIPRWQRSDEEIGRWQSIVILGLLNALFFFVNTIDAFYLWGSRAIPAGVSHSDFLHKGVASLIFAVILSAVVLVLLFQQKLAINSRLLQWLATGWVLQNVVIIAGVYLRLRLYVEELQLTLLRVGVGLFLLLVIAGFVLLAIYFWQGRSLGWLCKSNVIATFVLFFTVQFIDLEKGIADYNVNRYLRDGQRFPDVEYLSTLGHSAWPALIQLHQKEKTSSHVNQTLQMAETSAQQETRLWSWRRSNYLRAKRSREVIEYMGKQTGAR